MVDKGTRKCTWCNIASKRGGASRNVKYYSRHQFIVCEETKMGVGVE